MFKENSIRPINLIKQSKKFQNLDINFLKSKKFYFVKSLCPACDSPKKKFFMIKNTFKYFKCSNCATIYISPRPTEKILNELYKESPYYKFWNNNIYPATEKLRIKNIFFPRVKKIMKYVDKFKIKKNGIVDIGAGYGTFLEIFKKNFFFRKVYAVEPNKDGANFCKKKNIIVINKRFEKINKNTLKDISVATSFEVIEHLFSPKKFLGILEKVLPKKSLLVITCPNGLGFDLLTLKKKADNFDHEHLNYFNPKSIEILLKKNGFKVLEISTPGNLDVDIVINKIKQKKYRNRNDFLDIIFNSQLLKNTFQKYLQKNFLSSSLWVVAQKN
jgi:2-polyprenyl-3-methyl-5-hydroxy-6-metoxy-1,4-benzoquinol methylase